MTIAIACAIRGICLLMRRGSGMSVCLARGLTHRWYTSKICRHLIVAPTRTQAPGTRPMKTEVSPPNASSSPSPTDRGIDVAQAPGLRGAEGPDPLRRLAAGELLSERQLARSLKMSKTPVHAALERLEGDGLVTVTAQQGIVVRAISPQDIADHFEIREALETFVVSQARRATDGRAGEPAEAEPREITAVPSGRATSRSISGSTPSSTCSSASSTATGRSRVRWARFATRSTG